MNTTQVQAALLHYSTIASSTEDQLSRCWQETTEEDFREMLEVLFPERVEWPAFLVGEALTHGEQGAIHEAYTKIKGKFYMRPAYRAYFNADKYEQQIKTQFEL